MYKESTLLIKHPCCCCKFFVKNTEPEGGLDLISLNKRILSLNGIFCR